MCIQLPSYDLDPHFMTLKCTCIPKMKFAGQLKAFKVRARIRQTDRQTDRRDWKYYHTALASGNKSLILIKNEWSISLQLINVWAICLTLSLPITLRFYTLPYWSNPPFFEFLPERDYVTFGSLLSQFRLSSVVCRLSVCRLLSVTLVHPTQGVEPFGKISSPLCTLAILWPPCKILRR